MPAVAADQLSPRVLAQLRQGVERHPHAPAAKTVLMLLDEIDRLKTSPALDLLQPTADCPLTPVQLRIVAHTANGKECPEIGRELSLSPKTVRKYRIIAMQRLGVATAPQAVAVCLLRGWLPSAAVPLPDVPPGLSGARGRNAYRRRAEHLRERPGEWGTVATYYSPGAAKQSAYRLRCGAFTAFRPVGAWEAVASTREGVYIVRARYVGTPTHQAERAAS